VLVVRGGKMNPVHAAAVLLAAMQSPELDTRPEPLMIHPIGGDFPKLGWIPGGRPGARLRTRPAPARARERMAKASRKRNRRR
jgi:hypothetical protein